MVSLFKRLLVPFYSPVDIAEDNLLKHASGVGVSIFFLYVVGVILLGMGTWEQLGKTSAELRGGVSSYFLSSFLILSMTWRFEVLRELLIRNCDEYSRVELANKNLSVSREILPKPLRIAINLVVVVLWFYVGIDIIIRGG